MGGPNGRCISHGEWATARPGSRAESESGAQAGAGFPQGAARPQAVFPGTRATHSRVSSRNSADRNSEQHSGGVDGNGLVPKVGSLATTIKKVTGLFLGRRSHHYRISAPSGVGGDANRNSESRKQSFHYCERDLPSYDFVE